MRLAEGVPLFQVGWLARLRALRAQLVPARVCLAGDWLASPSIEGAISSAEAAVGRVTAWLAIREKA